MQFIYAFLINLQVRANLSHISMAQPIVHNSSLNISSDFETSYTNFEKYPLEAVYQDPYAPPENSRYNLLENIKDSLLTPSNLGTTSTHKPFYVVFREWNQANQSKGVFENSGP